MRTISEKEYRKIQRLRNKFYNGVERYCETLEDTSTLRDPFEEIMEILDNAKGEQ
jgi:hypothetical protein